MTQLFFVQAMKENFNDIDLSTHTIKQSVKNNLTSIGQLENVFIDNTKDLSQFFSVFELMEEKISMYSETIRKVEEVQRK
ncbi:hypothetical protein [Bacillus sp. CECT 9360]|uniref:hypothetical protein n=1 Tax=Bacillus sp. CECT 9360 TaxID=2845821 RepID=UPI001E2BC1B7|nr:hypothetical protein [Bacillus sp. CECT 9360]